MMRRNRLCAPLSVLALLAAPAVAAQVGAIGDATVERVAPGKLVIRWNDGNTVDVLQADTADADPASARIISGKDGDGVHEAIITDGKRPYFLLRDTRSGHVARVAERLLPLEQGSNFRDLGGYATADGRQVRWGSIYRSGAQAMLTDGDVRQVKALGIADLIDLRSDEERIIAPTRLDGIRYSAVGYSMMTMMAAVKPGEKPLDAGNVPAAGYADVYRMMPTQLAPQLRIVMERLTANDRPLVYNCSAGQDRTGFVSAVILSALGVPRETIYRDYLLSTPSRSPQWELPPISEAMAQSSPIAAFFARMQKSGAGEKANALMTADGTPFLAYAFQEIDGRWGSVEAYLEQEVGVMPADLAALRATYLQ